MRDAGLPTRRAQAKNATALANAIQKNFLERWCEDNEQNFIESMDMVREISPVKYADLYLKAKGMTMAKESNINITLNRQQDRENLQALVRTRMTLPDTGQYTPYEEVKSPQPAYKGTTITDHD